MPTQRNHAIDNLRGVLMAYVVIVVHGIFFLQLMPLQFAALLLFEMPAIFLVSGYAYRLWEAAQPAPLSGARAYTAFLLPRYARLLVPYACYALACATLVAWKESPQTVSARLAIYGEWLNPWTHGSAHTFSTLNWHLWFVPVFLVTTALLPFAAGLVTRSIAMLVPVALALFVFQWLTRDLEHHAIDFLRQSLTYLFFSVAGYGLARHGAAGRPGNWLALCVGALLVLILFAAVQGPASADMQKNKFQANHLFLVFSIAWIALFHAAARGLDSLSALTRTKEPWLLKPFITAGYSIYLWQGLAYAVAIQAGARYSLATGWILALAVALSVAVGLGASPVERLRFRR